MLMFLILVAFAGSSFANLNEVISLYEKSVLQCPERIWPLADLSKDKLVFFSTLEKKAFYIKKNTIHEIPFVDRMSDIELYDFVEFEGQVITWVNVSYGSWGPLKILNTAIHESFHLSHQSILDRYYSSIERDQIFPMQITPRLERQHMIEKFFQFFAGDKEAINEAHFWHLQHKISNEETGNDVVEGSANYVGLVTESLAALGCGASETELQNYFVDKIKFRKSQYPGGYAKKDSEFYDAGGLGFLYLRPRLNTAMNELKGIPFFDYLFLGLPVSNSNIIPELSKKVEEASFEINNDFLKVSLYFSSFHQNASNKESFIAVPYSSFLSTFSMGMTYKTQSGESFIEDFFSATKFGEVMGNAYQSLEADAACVQGSGYYFLKVTKIEERLSSFLFQAENYSIEVNKELVSLNQFRNSNIYCLNSSFVR